MTKELLDKIAELKEQMRSMLELAETEKRDLTDDEKASFDALNSRKHMLIRKLETLKDGNDPTEPIDVRAVFAENITKAVESGVRTSVNVRATSPIDSTDVVDTIPIIYKDVLEALEPALVLDKLGVKMQTNVQGEPLYPTVAGVEATIEGENVEVADSTLEFGKIKASPKRLALSVPVSRRAFNQSNLALYDIVVKALGKGIAKTLNKWFLQTTATALAGTTTAPFKKLAEDVTFATPNKPTYAEIVALETAVMDANVDATGVGGYIVSPNMAGHLKSTPVDPSSNGKMILENGEMNGYPVLVTNLVPQGHVFFGFYDYAVLAEFGRSEIIVDPYTGAKKNLVNFVVNGDFDQIVLRPEAFVLGA